MVLLGWVINKPLTLLMDPFESLVLYLSGMLPRLDLFGGVRLTISRFSSNSRLCARRWQVQLVGGLHSHL